MIEEYFLEVEKILREFPVIRSYALNKKAYNNQQGMIGGRIVFKNESSLEFLEVVDTEQESKLKYRYHYMDASQNLIFRYDNAPHHPQVSSFPHHKHMAEKVQPSAEPKLREILFEIARQIRSQAGSDIMTLTINSILENRYRIENKLGIIWA